MANRLLDLYGLGDQPFYSGDGDVYTTASLMPGIEREQAWKNSLFGRLGGWLDTAYQPDLEGGGATIFGKGLQAIGLDASGKRAATTPGEAWNNTLETFHPANLAAGGAGTMNRWLGAAAGHTDQLQTQDVLAPLGLSAMATPFMLRNGIAKAVAPNPQAMPRPTLADDLGDVLDLEPVSPGQRFNPSESWEFRSKHWPKSWFQDKIDGQWADLPRDRWDPQTVERAKLFVRESELMDQANAVLDPIQYRNGERVMSRADAERIAMQSPEGRQVLDDLHAAKMDFYEYRSPGWQDDGLGRFNAPRAPGESPAAAVDELFDGGSVRDLLVTPRQPPQKNNLLRADQSRSSIPGTVVNALEDRGIKAYHGSPHDFDRFDISKIGTGEGAQAFGRGLYFAESPGVAESYRNNLATRDYKVGAEDFVPKTDGEYDLQRALFASEGDLDRAVTQLQQQRQFMDLPEWQQRIDEALTAAEGLKSRGDYNTKSNGRMYEVRIDADPNDFLDWDLPLGQQSGGVKSALDPVIQAARKSYPDLNEANLTGEGAVRAYTSHRGGSSDVVAEALRDAGIPGIKYLDQGSRTAGDGSRNYVLFRDDIIRIVNKYGIAAAASLYGLEAVNSVMGDQSDIGP